MNLKYMKVSVFEIVQEKINFSPYSICLDVPVYKY